MKNFLNNIYIYIYGEEVCLSIKQFFSFIASNKGGKYLGGELYG